MEKDHLSIKEVVKKLQNQSKIETLSAPFNSCQFLSCCIPNVQVDSLNYSPFSSLKTKAKDKKKIIQ